MTLTYLSNFLNQASDTYTNNRKVFVGFLLLFYRDMLDISLLYCLFLVCPTVAEPHGEVHVSVYEAAL